MANDHGGPNTFKVKIKDKNNNEKYLDFTDGVALLNDTGADFDGQSSGVLQNGSNYVDQDGDNNDRLQLVSSGGLGLVTLTSTYQDLTTTGTNPKYVALHSNSGELRVTTSSTNKVQAKTA